MTLLSNGFFGSVVAFEETGLLLSIWHPVGDLNTDSGIGSKG
ncbi:hypothetical protein [Candidatus Williamhamiltonella defendens]|nr:hypothetical protein [Candidatus Hamiltonella defensa]